MDTFDVIESCKLHKPSMSSIYRMTDYRIFQVISKARRKFGMMMYCPVSEYLDHDWSRQRPHSSSVDNELFHLSTHPEQLGILV